jgi:hypothetical protein
VDSEHARRRFGAYPYIMTDRSEKPPTRGREATDRSDFGGHVPASGGDVDRFAELTSKYSLEMRFDSVPDLCRRFGVTFPTL